MEFPHNSWSSANQSICRELSKSDPYSIDLSNDRKKKTFSCVFWGKQHTHNREGGNQSNTVSNSVGKKVRLLLTSMWRPLLTHGKTCRNRFDSLHSEPMEGTHKTALWHCWPERISIYHLIRQLEWSLSTLPTFWPKFRVFMENCSQFDWWNPKMSKMAPKISNCADSNRGLQCWHCSWRNKKRKRESWEKQAKVREFLL